MVRLVHQRVFCNRRLAPGCASLALLLAALGNGAGLPPAQAETPASPIATGQALRQQERERLLRAQQERVPDVRLSELPTERDMERLPAEELPCLDIQRIVLAGDSADRFQWALAAAGRTEDGELMTLAEFIKTPEGKKMIGPTGGLQGFQGTLFGKPYEAGSWQDRLVEAFAGTHDYIGGSLSGLYDEEGSARRGMSDTERWGYDYAISPIAIIPSIPFAAAEGLPPEIWSAISILLRAAR